VGNTSTFDAFGGVGIGSSVISRNSQNALVLLVPICDNAESLTIDLTSWSATFFGTSVTVFIADAGAGLRKACVEEFSDNADAGGTKYFEGMDG
jgi:hypothetical protein